VVVTDKGQAPEIFPLIAVVVIGKTYCMMAVVVMMMGMIRIRSLLMRLLLPE